MNLEKVQQDNTFISCLEDSSFLLKNISSALDLITFSIYVNKTNKIILSKDSIDPRFFILQSGLAGEILQKFVDYHIQIGIWGDFSNYTSKPLQDFIYESNNGNQVFFLSSKEDCIKRLTK